MAGKASMILKGSLPQSRSQFLPAQIFRTYYAGGKRLGKQIRRSLKTTDPALARRRLDIPVCAWPKESISLGEMWIETGGPSSSRTADGEESRGAGDAVIFTSRKSRGRFSFWVFT